MEQIIASVFFDKFFYYIGNIIFCIFKNFEFNIFCIFKNFELSLIFIAARVYKLRLAEVTFFLVFFVFQWRAPTNEYNTKTRLAPTFYFVKLKFKNFFYHKNCGRHKVSE